MTKITQKKYLLMGFLVIISFIAVYVFLLDGSDTNKKEDNVIPIIEDYDETDTIETKENKDGSRTQTYTRQDGSKKIEIKGIGGGVPKTETKYQEDGKTKTSEISWRPDGSLEKYILYWSDGKTKMQEQIYGPTEQLEKTIRYDEYGNVKIEE